MSIDRAPRLLVVDDEEPIRRLLERTLRGAGYDVTVAEDGGAALVRVAAAEPFDLLVSDLAMPGMQGDELARQLRQQTPGLKVLYVTGYADHLFATKPVLWEDEAFLEKPFPQASLEEAVSLLLFGHTRGRANVNRPKRTTA